MLIIISGPSCAGKNTIIKEIQDRYKDIVQMRSYTTRKKGQRDNENLEFYKHVSMKEFRRMIDAGDFFEYAEVHGNLYGTTWEYYKRAKNENIINDIDVYGFENVKNTFDKEFKIISIFVDAPNKILKQRLQRRGYTDECVQNRMKRNKLERKYKHKFMIKIKNIDLEKACSKLFKKLDKILEQK